MGSATDVAVTETVGVAGTVDGAVYKPVAEIVPQDAPLQPLPARVHETDVLVEFVIVAVNCFCALVITCADVGEIVILTGGIIVTTAVLDLDGSASEVAVTDTCDGLGMEPGAV